MDLNHHLQTARNSTPILPREEHIQETIRQSKAVCFQQEAQQWLTYREFLWTQLQYTRKRWWALQAALLLVAVRIVPSMAPDFHRVRTVGVIGCLFVVLMIPELWRNRESDSIQVEAACLYSLRQIYAARITLFGIVDVALLTLFSLTLGQMGFTLVDVLFQFLFPVTVTACICFWLLCGNQIWTELASTFACLFWCALWWLILMNEGIYRMIAPSVWTGIFALALILLALAIRKVICTANQHWEVDNLGITTG